MDRYARQLEYVTPVGQEKLCRTRLLVVGCGGLGSSCAYYLAAAGVGSITLMDYDTVEETNLNRQILHTEADIGRLKADSAAEKLSALNSGITVNTIKTRLTKDNAADLTSGYDVIASCTDNVDTRLILSGITCERGIPVVEAGVGGLTGFIMTILPGEPCFGCLGWEHQKPVRQVLGASCGVIGSMQAAETIKLILGMEHLRGEMCLVDLNILSTERIKLQKRADCPVCAKG